MDRPVSLWVYNKRDSVTENEGGDSIFDNMRLAISIIARQCSRDLDSSMYLIVVEKQGLDVVKHSILGRNIPFEVKTQIVSPSRIVGMHKVDVNERQNRDFNYKSFDTYFSPKKYLKRLHRKQYKKLPSFYDFLQNFYFHFTCASRIKSINAEGLVSSAAPTIDVENVDGGNRCSRKRHSHSRKRKQTSRKRKQTSRKRKQTSRKRNQ